MMYPIFLFKNAEPKHTQNYDVIFGMHFVVKVVSSTKTHSNTFTVLISFICRIKEKLCYVFLQIVLFFFFSQKNHPKLCVQKAEKITLADTYSPWKQHYFLHGSLFFHFVFHLLVSGGVIVCKKNLLDKCNCKNCNLLLTLDCAFM